MLISTETSEEFICPYSSKIFVKDLMVFPMMYIYSYLVCAGGKYNNNNNNNNTDSNIIYGSNSKVTLFKRE